MCSRCQSAIMNQTIANNADKRFDNRTNKRATSPNKQLSSLPACFYDLGFTSRMRDWKQVLFWEIRFPSTGMMKSFASQCYLSSLYGVKLARFYMGANLSHYNAPFVFWQSILVCWKSQMEEILPHHQIGTQTRVRCRESLTIICPIVAHDSGLQSQSDRFE